MKRLKTILLCNKWFLLSIIVVSLYVLINTVFIKYSSVYDGTETSISGIVTKLSLNGNKLSMTVEGEESVITTYYLKTEEEKNTVFEEIHLGDSITLSGSLSEPLNNTIPNTFNYKKYLYNKLIYYTFSIDSFEVTRKSTNIFYNFKDFLLKRAYSLDNSDYLLTFILGDKTLLDTNSYNNYLTNGISHLLAISGMHIGVLLMLLNKLFKRLGEKREFILTSIVLILFSFITSFSASVLRAVLFFILNKINKIFNLKFSNLQILIITAEVILLINPFYIYDLGFIYSFVITFGIIYYQDKISGNYIVSMLKLSIVTFLFSLPISAYSNYQVNFTSILLNLIFVPLISIIVYPVALITFIFPIFSNILTILINFTNYLNTLCTYIALNLVIPKISIPLIIIYYISIIFGKKKKVLYIFMPISIITCIILPKLDSNYYVYYFDVGQGDSSVYISPHKSEVVMIDTGGTVSYGTTEEWEKSSKTYNVSDNVIKFLKSIGVTKINYLILSHGDTDHLGDALNVIDNLNVKNIILNIGDYNTNELEIIDTGINITDNINLKYFNIINLNDYDYGEENDNSIISYITFDSFKILSMGDATTEQEEYILSKYVFPKIDFIKLGHHGSKTSTGETLVSTLNFSYGIISSGRNNMYNHPSTEVIERLQSYNKFYYNTQDSGTIEVIFGNNYYTINTYKP